MGTILASSFHRTHAQETRYITYQVPGTAVRKSTKRVPGGESRDQGQRTAAIQYAGRVERFGRLGVEGTKFTDQLAASAVGGRDGGSMGMKGSVKERLLQIVSVTTQVAVRRRVSRFRLQLRGRQESRRSRGGGGDDRPTPMAWGWSLDAG